MQVISRDARARLSPIIDVKVMTAASARFAAPWGHHSGPMLRQDLHKVQWKPKYLPRLYLRVPCYEQAIRNTPQCPILTIVTLMLSPSDCSCCYSVEGETGHVGTCLGLRG